MNIYAEIGIIAGGLYEVLSRIIPTKKNVSIIHLVLQGLLFLSNALNNKAKTNA